MYSYNVSVPVYSICVGVHVVHTRATFIPVSSLRRDTAYAPFDLQNEVTKGL